MSNKYEIHCCARATGKPNDISATGVYVTKPNLEQGIKDYYFQRFPKWTVSSLKQVPEPSGEIKVSIELKTEADKILKDDMILYPI